MRKKIHIVLTILLILGIGILSQLVWDEYTYGNICPRFLIIPVCYIGIVYLLLLLLLHIFSKELWYLLINGFGIALAGFASVLHYFEKIECIILEFGIVSCYLYFVFFLVYLILKAIQLRMKYS